MHRYSINKAKSGDFSRTPTLLRVTSNTTMGQGVLLAFVGDVSRKSLFSDLKSSERHQDSFTIVSIILLVER